MQHPEQRVIEIMKDARIDFTATLPCDRIKNLIPLVWQSFKGVRLTREEEGAGICAGAWLTGARPMMVIQSTGLGNMVTALASLNQASRIPLPVLASYRGFYKEGIDSQIPLGEQLPGILQGCRIPYTLIDTIEKLDRLSDVINDAFDNGRPHVALFSPKVWENSGCTAWQENPPLLMQAGEDQDDRKTNPLSPIPKPQMTRYDAMQAVGQTLSEQIVVCNLGIPAKELYAACDRPLNYYMLGSMGLASSIGLGMALCQQRQVMVLDGDGSLLMNPNALITVGQYQPPNLMIVALDNGAYGSTGSQNTFTQAGFDLEGFARCCEIPTTCRVNTAKQLIKAAQTYAEKEASSFIHVVLKPGNSGCSNIPMRPEEITRRFMDAL